MPKRPRHRRSSDDFSPGTIVQWPPDQPGPEDIARRVRYIASGEHKSYPPPVAGLWTLNPKADKAKCDRFAEAEWPRLQEALRAAIEAGCVGKFRREFPSRAWIYINNILHEARLSNPAIGEYHGFPLEYEEQYPDDPHGLLGDAPRVTIAVR